MCRPRRMFINSNVYHVTNRTSEGLPFVCSLLIKSLMFGILARARELYPSVQICAWLFMGNHFHGIIVNRGDSSAIPNFMEYVDGEMGRAINRLRGRRRFTVWSDRYHVEALLTAGAVINKLVYLFLNPARANLVEHITQYTGASTWREFLGHPNRLVTYYGSRLLSKLPRGHLTKKICIDLLYSYRGNAKNLPKHKLIIESFAWLDCFEESMGWTELEVRQEVLERIENDEIRLVAERKKNKVSVLGVKTLEGQSFFKTFETHSFSPASLCSSTCEIARAAFMSVYKEFREKCRECWVISCLGLYDVEYPAGAFKPNRSPNASILSRSSSFVT